MDRTCQRCGLLLPAKLPGRGRRRLYCAPCVAAIKKERDTENKRRQACAHPCACGAPKSPRTERCLRCSIAVRPSRRRTYTCQSCGGAFWRKASGCRRTGEPTDRMLYCSIQCAADAKRVHAADLRRAKAALAPPPEPRRCRNCACVLPVSARQPNVSARASGSRLCAVCAERRTQQSHAASRARWREQHPWRNVTLTCAACKGDIAARARTGNGRRRKYCALCRKHVNRLAKPRGNVTRARQLGVQCDSRLNPIAVFERDGWRCQLCGCRTPRPLRGTYHARAPELDHIVPLSRGGGHVYDNAQCACRACNSAKGARIAGQLRLLLDCTGGGAVKC